MSARTVPPCIEDRANDHRAGNMLSSVPYTTTARRIAQAEGRRTSPDDDDDDDDELGSGREKKCGAMLFCARIRSFNVCTCIVKHVPLSLAMKPDRAGLHAAACNNAMPYPIVNCRGCVVCD